MYNGTHQGMYNVQYNYTTQGFMGAQSASINPPNQTCVQVQGQLCQYYNIQQKKKSRISNQLVSQSQSQLTQEQLHFRDVQNIKIQKQLNQQNQGQQYPFIVQQSSNLQMLVMKDLYSNFFPEIMREYKFYQQAIGDLDMQYPIQNKIKKSANNNREWLEQNYLNILKCQLLKNNSIKQTILEFRNSNLPKRVKRMIENREQQQKYNANRRVLEVENGYNFQQKQQLISPRTIYPSASPINRAAIKEIRFKSNLRQTTNNNSSKQTTRTEGSQRSGFKDDSLDKTQQIFAKRVIYNQKDKKESQQAGGVGQKRYDSVFRRLVTYDDNMQGAQQNGFEKGILFTKQGEEEGEQEQLVYMAGGVKIRVNSFADHFRSERSQSQVKETLNKGEKYLNSLNLGALKVNINAGNQRKQYGEQSISISPKHNYQVYMDTQNLMLDEIQMGQQTDYESDVRYIKDNNSYEEKYQIIHLIKEEKQFNRQSTHSQYSSSAIGKSKSKNSVSNQPSQMLNSVVKQQNMQLLKMENLHTSPTNRSKQQSFTSVNNTNTNSGLIPELKYKLQINPNCPPLPAMKVPTSNKVQGTSAIKDLSQQRKQENNGAGVVIIQQNQGNLSNTPIPSYSSHHMSNQLPLTPPSGKLKDNSVHTQKNNVLDQKMSQHTPLQAKSFKQENDEDNNHKSQTKCRDRSTLKDLICSYYQTPKNNNLSNQANQLSFSKTDNQKKQVTTNQKQEDISLNLSKRLEMDDLLNYDYINLNNEKDSKSPQQISSTILKTNQKYSKDINGNHKDHNNYSLENKNQSKETINAPLLTMSKLLAQKDQHLINSQFNNCIQRIQNSSQNEQTFVQVQNTIWFQNNSQNNNISENEQSPQVESISQGINQQNSLQLSSNLNNSSQPNSKIQPQNFNQSAILSNYDDKYSVMLRARQKKWEKSIELDTDCALDDDDRGKLISSTEGIFKSTISTCEKKKSSQDLLSINPDSSVLGMKLEDQFKSSPATPFRQSNHPRQRIYQNQRQILTDIQKGDHYMSYIKNQNNSKQKKESLTVHSISNDQETIKQSKPTFNKSKNEQKNNSQNILKQSNNIEKSEERQAAQKFSNPYLQKNEFFKKQKRKENSFTSSGQAQNLNAYQIQAATAISNNPSKIQSNSTSSVQVVKLLPIQHQNDYKQTSFIGDNSQNNSMSDINFKKENFNVYQGMLGLKSEDTNISNVKYNQLEPIVLNKKETSMIKI